MIYIALKILMGDRVKFIGLLLGISFTGLSCYICHVLFCRFHDTWFRTTAKLE